ncbi:MAG: DEAD/DEAH box helicase [Clostridia bacterium]|nr:DEAD/DEAH box helicase [Clostridia bacterium]MBQ3462109.1 DEAD/DEAH box helicase [Clostridia bacterium]MBQ3472247.1 DEAD/DEAH box helicase [Clostridia bacterium]MBR0470976.1 DEAD/DEAH box helicase [Clostridia bacterium]
MQLYDYQERALVATKDKARCAFYYDMGLGKTFIGSERMRIYGKAVNIVICQKSKIRDWKEHFETHYKNYIVCDLTKKREFELFITQAKIILQSRFLKRNLKFVGIINYELAYRRTELLSLIDFTLMLDESSMIKNEVAKRTKFILKLAPAHVILLSGTPTDGKYEYLYSQLRLLGWKITKIKYYEQYIQTKLVSYGGPMFRVVTGYKNIDDLKAKLAEFGALFAKADEVITLPEKTFIPEYCEVSKEYKRFLKDRVITIQDKELVGDTSLTKRLYARMLCSAYSEDKLKRFADLIDSTSDRVIVFYNFNSELSALLSALPKDRPRSVINGSVKDLIAYEDNDNSVTFVQYQAGAMGLNLQKANRIIYFSLPERSELFEQSKARICRIGQDKQCYYHIMMCKGSVEEKILDCLKMRKDYTDELFRKDFG